MYDKYYRKQIIRTIAMGDEEKAQQILTDQSITRAERIGASDQEHEVEGEEEVVESCNTKDRGLRTLPYKNSAIFPLVDKDRGR